MGKILIINPACEGAEFARGLLANEKDVDVVGIAKGPKRIQSAVSYALAGFEMVKKAREAEKAGYEAIIITCHGDPNLFNLREAVRIPVLGCTQTAIHFCSLLARRFSILNPSEIYTKWSKEDALARYGFTHKLASIRRVEYQVPKEEVGKLSRLRPVPEGIIGPVVSEAIKAIEEDGATAITFGCGLMAGLADELQARLKEKGYDVLVVKPLFMALEMARLLIRNKLTHSAIAFPLDADPGIVGD